MDITKQQKAKHQIKQQNTECFGILAVNVLMNK